MIRWISWWLNPPCESTASYNFKWRTGCEKKTLKKWPWRWKSLSFCCCTCQPWQSQVKSIKPKLSIKMWIWTLSIELFWEPCTFSNQFICQRFITEFASSGIVYVKHLYRWTRQWKVHQQHHIKYRYVYDKERTSPMAGHQFWWKCGVHWNSGPDQQEKLLLREDEKCRDPSG